MIHAYGDTLFGSNNTAESPAFENQLGPPRNQPTDFSTASYKGNIRLYNIAESLLQRGVKYSPA